MKKHIKTLYAALLLCLAQVAHAAELLDSIVTIVDEDVITRIELQNKIRDYSLQLNLSLTKQAEKDALRKQVLEKIIRDRIQLQMAEKMGIKVDDVALNRTLERLAAANNISLDQMRRTMEADGMQFKRFREQTRDELIIKQLQQRLVANRVTISDQEVDQLIDDNQKQAEANLRYKLRHILVSTSGTASPEEIKQARAKVETLYQRIVAGENFSDLAIQNSSGRNALNGGELGWRSSSELPDSFVDALQKARTGETTAPIRSPSGFHLLFIEESSKQQNVVVQTKARHILLRDESGDAENTLNELRKRISEGEDFAELAREHSADKGSRDNGGDLGWADPGTFVPAFESTMQTLEAGEVSEPFRSQFGWHIVQVLGRRESTANRESLVKLATQQIRARKTEEELRLWLQKIRDEAYVEYVDNSSLPN